MNDSKDILMALGRLEGKMESILTMQRTQSEELSRLDKRVRILEQGKSALLGGSAVVGSIAAAFVSWIFKGL